MVYELYRGRRRMKEHSRIRRVAVNWISSMCFVDFSGS